MRSVRASRCRRRVRWIAFRSGTVERPMTAEPFVMAKAGAVRRDPKAMVRGRDLAVPAARRGRANPRKASRDFPKGLYRSDEQAGGAAFNSQRSGRCLLFCQ